MAFKASAFVERLAQREGLSTRAYRTLVRLGVDSPEALGRVTSADVLAERGIGRNTWTEILAVRDAYGASVQDTLVVRLTRLEQQQDVVKQRPDQRIAVALERIHETLHGLTELLRERLEP